MEKSPEAFRTIGELSAELGVPQHVLRYWETKFPQLKPLQRAGNRRYYRAAEVTLARRINHLLNVEGYTVRGVQKLLADKAQVAPATPMLSTTPAPLVRSAPEPAAPLFAIDIQRLRALRDRLQDALAV